ncbi:MAG: 4Fe-4S binding protein [Candidatus Thermoplasmatota archaeon]|nr:4Fe-4S binding protein [Candidatus Thermoplasmatota archaeon]
MEKVNIGAVITTPGSSMNYKTGSWRTLKPILIEEKCKFCNTCWQFCPDGAIEPADAKAKKTIRIDYDYCKGCGICAHECPFDALEMVTEEK